MNIDGPKLREAMSRQLDDLQPRTTSQEIHRRAHRARFSTTAAVCALLVGVAAIGTWAVEWSRPSDGDGVVGPGPNNDRVIELTPLADLTITVEDRAQGVSAATLRVDSNEQTFSTAIVAFDRPAVALSCIEQVNLRMYLESTEQMRAIPVSLYPSSVFTAADLHDGDIVEEYGRLLDTRPKDEVEVGFEEGWVDFDATEIYRLWVTGRPFPSMGRTVPGSAPIVFALRAPTLSTMGDHGNFARRFASSESDFPPTLIVETNDDACHEQASVPPRVARLVCDENGMRYLDPQVRPQRDGIHLEVINRSDAHEFYIRRPDGPENQGGKLKRMGTTEIQTTMAPGEIYVGCYEDNEDINYAGGPEGLAVITIVDPENAWVSPELDCQVEERRRIRGGPVDDAQESEDAIRAVVPGIEADDEIRRAGYPLTEWHGEFRMVVRDGEPVATVMMFQQRGRWHAFVDACEGVPIG